MAPPASNPAASAHTPSPWLTALSLFDQAQGLVEPARSQWLEQAAHTHPQAAPLLRKLLHARARIETNDLLFTLPKVLLAAAPASAGQPGQRLGAFELLELVGKGGMGEVWRARYADGRLKREVALKLPTLPTRPDGLSVLKDRLARERDVLAQLEHPNIARLYDTGLTEAGLPFLAMEFVEGQSIDTHCQQRQLTIQQRLALFLQVVHAVDHAHRQLVLHRDIKPSNIWVDQSGQVRLLDFGVAKLLEPDGTKDADEAQSELTQAAGVMLTLAYAAPEQITHDHLSTSADVYALGVVLYRLLTGLSPYSPKRETLGALEHEVLHTTPELASARKVSAGHLAALNATQAAYTKAVSGDLDTILAKALKKSPGERYPTAAALAADISRHLNRLPIEARADSWAYRASRFYARHRLATAIGALGMTALLGSTAAAVWQANLASAAAVQAQQEAKRANTAQRFLVGMFGTADPAQHKVSVDLAKTILVRGEQTAAVELATDAQAHSVVLGQIGDIYYRLGLHADNLKAQRKRIGLIDRMSGASADLLADAQMGIGNALDASEAPAEQAEAKAWFERAVQTTGLPGASAAKRVLALSHLADYHRVQRNLPTAQALSKQALELAVQTQPDPSAELAIAHATHAAVAQAAGDFEAARANLRAAVRIDASGQGRGLFQSFESQVWLASLEFDAGRYAEAREQALNAIAFAQNKLGDIQGALAPARRLAVFAADASGDASGALALAQTHLAAELQSTEPLRVVAARLALARVHLSLGEWPQAQKQLEQSAQTAAQHRVWRTRHAQLSTELLLRTGSPKQALAAIQQALAQQERDVSSGHPDLAYTREWLAVALARSGLWAQAFDSITASCSIRAQARAAQHPARVRCEAYRILLDSSLDQAAAQQSLKKLKSDFGSDQRSPSALAQSLQPFVSTPWHWRFNDASAFPVFR